MRLWNSLQVKFFLAYSIVFVVITLSVSFPMYVYLKKDIEKNTFNNVNSTVINVSDRLNESMNQFDTISKQLYLNADISGKTAVQYLEALLFRNDSYDSFQVKQALQNFVSFLSSMYTNIYRISVFTVDGEFFSNQIKDNNISQTLDLRFNQSPILQSEGEALLNYDSEDPWFVPNNIPFFTYNRLLMPMENRIGVIEVQVKVADLLPLDQIISIRGANLTIFADSRVVYSTFLKDDKHLTEIISTYQKLQLHAPAVNASLPKNISTDNEYAFYQTNEKTGITVMLTVPETTIFAPLHLFRNVTLATVLLLILFSVLVFYFLSRFLSQPLVKLRSVIDSIDLDEKKVGIDNKYQMDEIELINRSFRKMNERLQNSVEEIVRFRTLQLQSHFDTLQAQINPHFLFNMLGVIQASAEKGHLEQVNALSQNLAAFFRYSISTSSPLTTFEKEVDFTLKYLELMQIRYLHRLHYTVQIDPYLNHMLVPKLILQPLVENCLQHGFGIKHTLEISITALVIEDSWEVHIRDNGAGIPFHELQSLIMNIKSYLDRLYTELGGERLTLGGMGMASTLGRLTFMFKDRFHFSIENNADGGLLIILRGPMNTNENYDSIGRTNNGHPAS